MVVEKGFEISGASWVVGLVIQGLLNAITIMHGSYSVTAGAKRNVRKVAEDMLRGIVLSNVYGPLRRHVDLTHAAWVDAAVLYMLRCVRYC